MTVGRERPEEGTANTLRSVMTGFGFTEIMSLNLNSIENLFTRLRIEPGETYVSIDNPKTINQKVLRGHLLTGIMETFEHNRKKTVPQRIFEIGPVTVLNPKTETGIDEYRHLSFAVTGPDTGYAEARALLDSVLRELGYYGQYQPAEFPTFIEGRCAEVEVKGGTVNGLWARLGEIHPQVLENFNLSYPVVCCELRFTKVF
jgi:phenylalanyl-tRNA synthetase beta chain